MGKSLVIIDMQNDFITGSLGTPEAIEAERYILKELDFSSFSRIFLTRDTHFDSYMDTMEGHKLPIPHCIKNTNGWQISSAIMDKIHEVAVPYYFLDKHSFGYPCWNVLFSHLLNDDEFVIVGVCTDICVISNALILKALYPETPIKVISYMCAGTTPEKHDEALDVMRSCHIDVV